MTNIKKVMVYEGSSVYLPDNAQELIRYFQDYLDKVPAEYQANATIDLDTASYYESTSLNMEMYYYRPKTDKEISEDKITLQENKKALLLRRKQEYEGIIAQLEQETI